MRSLHWPWRQRLPQASDHCTTSFGVNPSQSSTPPPSSDPPSQQCFACLQWDYGSVWPWLDLALTHPALRRRTTVTAVIALWPTERDTAFLCILRLVHARRRGRVCTCQCGMRRESHCHCIAMAWHGISTNALAQGPSTGSIDLADRPPHARLVVVAKKKNG
jgi:hypothetical protein